MILFAIRGFLRGTIAQVFIVLGLLSGLWAAVAVFQWVGEHWRGARPAVVFLILRWLVAALAGTSLAALFQWWGERVGGAVREGALGFLDRAGGFAMGAVLGVASAALVLMAGLLLQHPRGVRETVAETRLAAPVMGQAVRVCSFGEPYVPGSHWLKERFQDAQRHTRRSSAARHDARS